MKTRFQTVSLMVLIAMLISLVPAAAVTEQASAAVCFQAQFVADVTIPDGSNYQPNAAFKKTWRLRNIGTCAWNGVTMVFDSGAQMGAPASVPVQNGILPGQTVDVSVDMTAPNSAGHYIGYWKFKSEQGTLFGIGVNANKSWWVEINVVGTPSTNIAFDFIAKANEAEWSSLAGKLPFPGADNDARGYALTGLHWIFEDNSSPLSSMLVGPQNIANGYVQGVYPEFTVERGDVFQTQVGCEFQAKNCYVQFRLAYQRGTGPSTTIWQFNEKWEGLTKPVTFRPLNLDFLAGQKVRFILFMSAYGSPVGDRALWADTAIVRKGSVPPPPTVTGTPSTSTPTKIPPPITQTVPPSACDRVQFVADVNYPDGSLLAPGQTFTKTWRLKNVGSCAWTTSYQMVFFSGEQMGAPTSAAFTKNIEVGQTIDISVPMTAPAAAGSYRGYWMFKNASGALFGIGSQANKPWWVDIRVSGLTVTPGGPSKTPTPSSTPTTGGPTITPIPGLAYDFATNACSGTWFSGAGQLPCPGADGDARGFALKLSSAKLETGGTDPRPSILTFPQNVENGYVQGFFPPFKVQSGDRFRSTIGCEGGSTLCYVAYRLEFQSGSDPITTLWGPFLERYEGQSYNVDVDLTPLAGRDVKFILTALAVGPATGDRALWVGPHIFRPGGVSAQPDLAISSISISFPNPSCFNPGENLGVRLSVTNGGQASAGSFNVKVGAAEQAVNGLAVGETKSVFFTGYTNPVTAVVDSGNAIPESNEQNNTRTENVAVPTPPLPCAGPSPTFTPTPSTSATVDPMSGWGRFQNDKYKFFVKVSPDASAGMSDNSGRADLKFAPNTNLREKYLAILIVDGAATCKYASGFPTSSSNVTINGVQFLKESGSEGAAGSFFDWVSYSTIRNNACINLAFVLKSVNPGNLPVPPPVFDKATESAIFDQIINTFAFFQ